MRATASVRFGLLVLLGLMVLAMAARADDVQKREIAPEWQDLGWAWGKRADPSMKREIAPEWQDLGWAWGKRADPSMRVLPLPRMIRSLQPMKKNPEWHDLGWTWGRK